ncbi:MAG: hypothetical protein KME20_26745 [Kaiparowitsia implicata GSE-PSE-MK54-09C]|nr:hypothetical protein [Kaiparowitsia implicata GSE-PSE-MK54-09C]
MTPEQRSGLARLMLRLPHVRAALPRAVDVNPLLRELCGDYEVATVASKHWAVSMAAQAPEIAHEYARALLEIEREVELRTVSNEPLPQPPRLQRDVF